jgi:hypothetical protein
MVRAVLYFESKSVYFLEAPLRARMEQTVLNRNRTFCCCEGLRLLICFYDRGYRELKMIVLTNPTPHMACGGPRS